MLLAIDVGNTHTVLGLFDGPDLLEHWRIATEAHRTADEIAVVLRGLLAQHEEVAQRTDATVDGIALCSTVPSILHEMREVCVRYYGDVPAVVVEPGVRTGVPVLTDNPKEVGTDRVVNALAAVELFGGPCIVVDFGTATTYDVVSEKGEFLGGAIGPGVGTKNASLTRETARLPLVELHAPRTAIGKNTIEAIQSGLVYGTAAEADGIVERMRKELGGDATVIATGGLAPVIAPHCNFIDEQDPWLTLEGLRLVFDRNVAQADDG
jgi:type III pantothenate kinase